jgi:hypothetical protein
MKKLIFELELHDGQPPVFRAKVDSVILTALTGVKIMSDGDATTCEISQITLPKTALSDEFKKCLEDQVNLLTNLSPYVQVVVPKED